MYSLLHRMNEAEAQVRRTLTLDPNYAHANLILGLVLVGRKHYAEAVAPLRRAIELGGDYDPANGALVAAYAGSGDRATAHKLLDELIEGEKRGKFGPFALAIAYTGLGDNDRAIAAMNRAIDRRDIFLPEVFFDPVLIRSGRIPAFAGWRRGWGWATNSTIPSPPH